MVEYFVVVGAVRRVGLGEVIVSGLAGEISGIVPVARGREDLVIGHGSSDEDQEEDESGAHVGWPFFVFWARGRTVRSPDCHRGLTVGFGGDWIRVGTDPRWFLGGNISVSCGVSPRRAGVRGWRRRNVLA